MQRRLSSILEDVAAELAQLAQTAECLQSELAPSVSHMAAQSFRQSNSRAPCEPDGDLQSGHPPEAEAMMALQSLDYLTQSLHCLSSFLRTTAGDVSFEGRVDISDALATVWLARLKHRLGQLQIQPALDDDVELFETF